MKNLQKRRTGKVLKALAEFEKNVTRSEQNFLRKLRRIYNATQEKLKKSQITSVRKSLRSLQREEA